MHMTVSSTSLDTPRSLHVGSFLRSFLLRPSAHERF